MSGPSTPLDPYAQQGMQHQYTPATVRLIHWTFTQGCKQKILTLEYHQFFEDFSYWDMDQWDLASMPMGLT